MSTSDSNDTRVPDLQFSTLEPVEGQGDDSTSGSKGVACNFCKMPIADSYYAVGDKVLCTHCKDSAMAQPRGGGFFRFLKATALGTGAGLIGALIWYLIRVIAHIELGLVAILVGFMVGKTVHRASGFRGGVGYQILALFITYFCISANYAPDIFDGLMKKALEEQTSGVDLETVDQVTNDASPTVDATPDTKRLPAVTDRNASPDLILVILVGIATVVLSLAAPILMGLQNPIGLIIIAIALWEAWKFTAHHPIPITGPYQIAAPGISAEATN